MSSHHVNNDTDIFRKTPILKPSSEHLIPAGLGGKLEVTGLIGDTMNAAFGGTIDKVLLEALELFRARLGLESRRGDAIHVVSDGGSFDLSGDKPVLKHKPGPPWEVTELPDGSLNFAITASTVERAKDLARHARRARRVENRAVKALTAKRIHKHVPPMQFQISIGEPLQLRALAKCCLTYLAYALGPKTALEPCFDGSRAYVLDGVDNYEQLLNDGAADQQPRLAGFDLRIGKLFKRLPFSFGPLDHRLVIHGSATTGVVYATLELFGYIPFSILLSRNWTKQDFCRCLVMDPRPDGKWCHEDLPHYARPEVDGDFILAHEANPAKLNGQLTALLAETQKMVVSRANHELVEESRRTVLGEPDGKPFTPEKVDHVAQEIAERFVSRELRLDRETEIPLTDF